MNNYIYYLELNILHTYTEISLYNTLLNTLQRRHGIDSKALVNDLYNLKWNFIMYDNNKKVSHLGLTGIYTFQDLLYTKSPLGHHKSFLLNTGLNNRPINYKSIIANQAIVLNELFLKSNINYNLTPSKNIINLQNYIRHKPQLMQIIPQLYKIIYVLDYVQAVDKEGSDFIYSYINHLNPNSIWNFDEGEELRFNNSLEFIENYRIKDVKSYNKTI